MAGSHRTRPRDLAGRKDHGDRCEGLPRGSREGQSRGGYTPEVPDYPPPDPRGGGREWRDPRQPRGRAGHPVKMPQPKKARVLSAEEVGALVSAANAISGPSDALAIEVMFFLGLRIGEMAGLQAQDLDKVAGELIVRRTVTDVGVISSCKSLRRRTGPRPPDTYSDAPLGKLLTSLD